MKKKYQIFLSSTYSDLRSERDAITRALYEMSCIPVGMEAFPAADEEQFEFIKKIIDDSDYYILLLGARYGSLAEDGKSYTEKEYDYAITSGIPVLAFVHSSPAEIETEKSDLKASSTAEHFYRFRNSVMKTRVVKMWDDPAMLPAFVVLALNRAFSDFPRTGWVRGSAMDPEETLVKMLELQDELSVAKQKIQEMSAFESDSFELANLDVDLEVKIDAWRRDYNGSVVPTSVPIVKANLKYLFSMLGPNLIESLNQDTASNILALNATEGCRNSDAVEYKYTLERETLNTIRLQLEALGLMKVFTSKTVGGAVGTFWQLTDRGLAEVKNLRLIRKGE